MSNRLRQLCCFVLLLSATGGCALLSPKVSDVSELPVPRLSDDSVVLEILTLRVPTEELARVRNLWEHADEQHLPNDLRRELVQAGLRCGVVGTQPPEMLLELINETESAGGTIAGEEGETMEVGDDVLRRLQCRAGKPHRIAASETRETMPILWREDDEVRGMTFYRAQAMFELRAYPQADGRVRLSLLPEIHHGAAKNQWIGRDGMFLLEAGQDRESYGKVKMKATLSPGETLILGAAENATGLGQHFFGENCSATGDHKLLLIRLALTQYDDVHVAPATATEPIATAE